MKDIKIVQKHLPECDSTQKILSEWFDKYDFADNPHTELLVSTEFQSQGKGRKGNEWLHFENGLAFSFTLDLQEKFGLVMLEIATILAEFFKPYKLKIKWPNDLMNSSGEKCGGIIATARNTKAIVGVGINLIPELKKQNTNFSYGSINYHQELKDWKVSLPKTIVRFIYQNRIQKHQIPDQWSQYCIHHNTQVKIDDFGTIIRGKFKGISIEGAALIQTDSQTVEVMNGSLFLNG